MKLLLVILFFVGAVINAQSGNTLTAKFEKRSFSGDTTKINYRFFQPQDFDAGKIYPLVLTLHGAGERGDDNESQIKYHKLATIWAEPFVQADNPCFVVSPQCPKNNKWVDINWGSPTVDQDTVPLSNELETVMKLLDEIIKNYPIDKNRIYITGLSMGGFGTWDLITRFPNIFAAAIPMSGSGNPKKVESIKQIPIWVFHGTLDKAVPVDGSRIMVDALRKANGNVIYTEYKDKGYPVWTESYSNPLLIDWLFAQRKTNN
ncbi:MAG: prolyl oligopeptidase family serine peptidase [Bacteroidota bacterium]